MNSFTGLADQRDRLTLAQVGKTIWILYTPLAYSGDRRFNALSIDSEPRRQGFEAQATATAISMRILDELKKPQVEGYGVVHWKCPYGGMG